MNHLLDNNFSQDTLYEIDRSKDIDRHSRLSNATIVSSQKENKHQDAKIADSYSFNSFQKKNDDKEDEETCGYRWFIVLGAFLSQVVGLGIIMSVLQDYYEQNVYGTEGSTVIQLSLVGSVGNFGLNFFSPFVQALVTVAGIKSSILLATLLSTAGLELASFNTTIWQLILAQGLLLGAGGSIIFYVGMSEVQQWFSNKQGGLGLGIATSGSCIGSLIMPLVMTSVIKKAGIKVCHRVLGAITCILYLASAFLFKNKQEYLEKKSKKDIENVMYEKSKMKSGNTKIIDFGVLKDVNFILWCIADISIELCYYVPYFFLPSYATYLGFSDTKGSSLISIVSSCNAIGRIVAGMVADKIGSVNTIIISCLLAGCSSFFIWLFSYSFAPLAVFAAFFGFCGGSFISLGPSITETITGNEKFKSGYAMFLLITVVAMFGPNLASLLENLITEHSNVEKFLTYKLFTGCGYIFGAIILLILKCRIQKGNLIFSKL